MSDASQSSEASHVNSSEELGSGILKKMMMTKAPSVCVVSFTGDSGLTDYSASLCRSLSELLEVELVTAESFSDKKYAPKYKVSKVFRRTRNLPFDIWSFIAYIIRKRPSCLLFQSWIKYPLLEMPLIIFFRLLGIPSFITVHDLLPHHPKPWSRIVHGWYYRCFNGVIVHSVAQSAGIQAMGVSCPVLVVPHGVYDMYRTTVTSKEEERTRIRSINSSDFCVLFFGHLDERKGLVEYVECAAQMRGVHKDVKFIMAGKSDGRARVEEALQRATKLDNVIVFNKHIDSNEVQSVFTCCDVVALPYLEGTTSGVVKLAMAFSRPVICTDVGDLPETLSDWPGLCISRDGLTENLRDAILLLKNSAASGGSDAAVADKYSWTTIASAYRAHIVSTLSL